MYWLFLGSHLVQRLPDKSNHFPGTGYLDLVGVLAGQQQAVALFTQSPQTAIRYVRELGRNIFAPGL